MTDVLQVTRRGGFAGVTRTAHVTDPNLRAAILAELARITIGQEPTATRDAFIYTFHIEVGAVDAGAQADRNIREPHMTPTLRNLLRQLEYGA